MTTPSWRPDPDKYPGPCQCTHINPPQTIEDCDPRCGPCWYWNKDAV